MTTWAIATAAGVLLVYAALSRAIERTWLSAPIFFLSAGLIVGSKGLDWIDLNPRSDQVRILAELTLTLVLFADASRIDLPALRREYSVPTRLLGIGLPLTILAGWAIGAGLFGTFSLAEVLILAVILAPTDAALGQAVVTDPRLPSGSAKASTSSRVSTTASASRFCSLRSHSLRPRPAQRAVTEPWCS